MIYNQFDIVTVPFPFSDIGKSKLRPALVMSASEYFLDTGHYVLTMITTAKHSLWHNDLLIEQWHACGLPVQSIVRFKIFSLDARLIIEKLGQLDAKLQDKIKDQMQTIFRNKMDLRNYSQQ